MCVVPVRHCSSQKLVKIFALLNLYSQGIFVTKWIVKELDMPGIKTSINIKTLNGNQKVSSTMGDDIMISKQGMSTNDSSGNNCKSVFKERDSS